MKEYRDNGAIGALLDEYEKVLLEFIETINSVQPEELITIVDHKTKDANCKSIQTILTHVASAGYHYVIEIRKFLGEQIDYREGVTLNSIEEYKVALHEMFNFNEKLFDDYPDLELEEMDNQKKVLVRWGQLYNVEQLFEHAIVHILRHRRQIERILIKLRK